MRDWFSERFWAQLMLIITCFILFSLALTSFYIMPAQEENRNRFISECEQQHGQYVELDRRQYCIVDGVKIAG